MYLIYLTVKCELELGGAELPEALVWSFLMLSYTAQSSDTTTNTHTQTERGNERERLTNLISFDY